MTALASRYQPAARVAAGLLMALCAGAAHPETTGAAPERGSVSPPGPAPLDGTMRGSEDRLAAERTRLDTLARVYAGYYAQHPELPARLLRIGVSADDVSVAFWLAAKAAADPYAIASVRVQSRTPWAQLMRAYQVSSRALRVRLDGPAYGPYARPYRVLEGRAKGPLTDAEVRDLVQLRLLTEYYRFRPSRVIARRAAGRSATDLILDADRASGARPAGRPFGRRS